jgi:2'-5' RNA ligase
MGAMRGHSAVREPLAFRLAWLMANGWLRFSWGRSIRSLPPSGPDAASYYPAIIRLPPSIATSVGPALERLHRVNPHHHYYPAESMHVTIHSVSRFLASNSDIAARIAELREEIGSYPSFDLTLRGLNVSPTTVFAQVVPHDGAFRCLRKGLKARNSRPGRPSGLGAVARDLLPHANVVRFSGNVTADFLDEVSKSRQEWFGRWTVREVELVRTDKLLSGKDSQVLERIPLATP